MRVWSLDDMIVHTFGRVVVRMGKIIDLLQER
jgi:hypothetical protein